MTVVVSTVQRMFWTWAKPHVGKKISKGIPPFTDFNSSASPIFVSSGVRIIAARLHCLPRTVFWCSPASMFEGKFLIAANLFVKASARACVFLYQIVANNYALVSAITSAKPSAIALANIKERKDYQAVKTLAYEIVHIVVVTGEERYVN